ncbi:hypothetical protein F5887DRAFT_954791 [Amanita rubescens]|nr:hypothetical protein F5887DRAFT_954791 [Amanita rubescens]
MIRTYAATAYVLLNSFSFVLSQCIQVLQVVLSVIWPSHPNLFDFDLLPFNFEYRAVLAFPTITKHGGSSYKIRTSIKKDKR